MWHDPNKGFPLRLISQEVNIIENLNYSKFCYKISIFSRCKKNLRIQNLLSFKVRWTPWIWNTKMIKWFATKLVKNKKIGNQKLTRHSISKFTYHPTVFWKTIIFFRRLSKIIPIFLGELRWWHLLLKSHSNNDKSKFTESLTIYFRNTVPPPTRKSIKRNYFQITKFQCQIFGHVNSLFNINSIFNTSSIFNINSIQIQ